MTKKEKLYERIKNNPRNVRFSDLKQVLINENFTLERTSGSHHIFRKDDTIFVIPTHRNYVKTAVYVKRVVEILEEMRSK